MGQGIQFVRGRALSKGHFGPVEFGVKAGYPHPNSSQHLQVRARHGEESRDGAPYVQ